jgi:hypothetical protein
VLDAVEQFVRARKLAGGRDVGVHDEGREVFRGRTLHAGDLDVPEAVVREAGVPGLFRAAASDVFVGLEPRRVAAHVLGDLGDV